MPPIKMDLKPKAPKYASQNSNAPLEIRRFLNSNKNIVAFFIFKFNFVNLSSETGLVVISYS